MRSNVYHKKSVKNTMLSFPSLQVSQSFTQIHFLLEKKNPSKHHKGQNIIRELKREHLGWVHLTRS